MTIDEAIKDFEREYDYYNWSIVKSDNNYTIMAWNPYELVFSLRGIGNNIPQAFLDLKYNIENKLSKKQYG